MGQVVFKFGDDTDGVLAEAGVPELESQMNQQLHSMVFPKNQ